MHISYETAIYSYLGVLALFDLLGLALVAWGVFYWRRRRSGKEKINRATTTKRTSG
jgi:hypothetical protein